MLIANAPCSWGIFYPGNNRFTPDQYLDQLVGAGYRATELGPFGFLPTGVGELVEMLESRTLSLVGGVHVHAFSVPENADGLFRTLDDLAAILRKAGADHLVLMDEGNVYPDDAIGVLDAQGWRAMLETIEEARKRVEGEHGLTVSFHPHVATAIEHEHQIDRLLDGTNISLCLDTGHHAFWGQDPLAYMEKAWDRIAYMHLKNVDAAVRQQVLDGALGVRQSFAKGVMCPLPDGVVDIGAVMDMLETRGFAGPVVVEQDPSDDPALEPHRLARRNIEFLAQLNERAAQ
jgi:inosose dehydratase